MRWIYPSENGFVYRFVYALFTGLLTAKSQQPCGFSAFVNNVNKKIEENKLVQQRALRLQKKFSCACLHEFVYTAKNGLPCLTTRVKWTILQIEKALAARWSAPTRVQKKIDLKLAGR